MRLQATGKLVVSSLKCFSFSIGCVPGLCKSVHETGALGFGESQIELDDHNRKLISTPLSINYYYYCYTID